MPQEINIFLKTLLRDNSNQLYIVLALLGKILVTVYLLYSKNRARKSVF